MTVSKTTPSNADIKDAKKTIASFVDSKAKDRPKAERDDMKSDALASWLDGAGSPYNCARDAKSKHFRGTKRQERIRRERGTEIRLSSVGRESDAEEVAFSRAKESGLRDAVQTFCEKSYRASWSKEWDPAKAGRIRELTAIVDPEDVAAEKRAKAVVDELAASLRRAECAGRVIPVGPDGYATVGGPNADVLARSSDTIKSLLDTLRAPERSLLPRGYADESELRRFVARARTNPAIMVALGCTRRPPGEDPNSARSRTWVTRPDVDELTVIWLLSGGWPKITKWPTQGISVKYLVNRCLKPTVKTAVEAIDFAVSPTAK